MPLFANVPDEELLLVIKISQSYSEALIRLGYRGSGYRLTKIKELEKEGKLDTSHFIDPIYLVGSKPMSLPEILVKESSYRSSSDLRKRLIREGILQNKCYTCGLGPEWRGAPLILHLDHINGNHRDNRVENLRILCPNCHAQTDTYCGKNKRGWRKDRQTGVCLSCSRRSIFESSLCRPCWKETHGENLCSECRVPIAQSSHKCPGCRSATQPKRYKVDWPPYDELVLKVESGNLSAVGRELGVSANAVKKRLRVYCPKKSLT